MTTQEHKINNVSLQKYERANKMPNELSNMESIEEITHRITLRQALIKRAEQDGVVDIYIRDVLTDIGDIEERQIAVVRAQEVVIPVIKNRQEQDKSMLINLLKEY